MAARENIGGAAEKGLKQQKNPDVNDGKEEEKAMKMKPNSTEEVMMKIMVPRETNCSCFKPKAGSVFPAKRKSVKRMMFDLNPGGWPPHSDEEVVVEESDGVGSGGGCGGKSYGGSVFCSICLEIVADNGDRSWAKLQCGHEFHLDCFGSAFNIKGAMQCPNCRKIKKGQWLYSNGCCSFPELNMEDWTHDEDLYDLSYSEMIMAAALSEGYSFFGFRGEETFETKEIHIRCVNRK
ncbi:hypothetical protein ACFX2H_003885 [Malus domestica]